jgi:four helix bundle protein
MGWTRFTDIEAWNLSTKLRREFDAILDRPPASLDRRFCDDARDAVGSSARNIAEGFGRRGNREFARYVDIARGSLLETQTNLITARDRGFMSEVEFQRLWKVSEEAVATTTGLANSLRRRSGPR